MIIGALLVAVALASWGTATALSVKEAVDIESKQRQVTAKITLVTGESVDVYAESSSTTCTVLSPSGRETNAGEQVTKLSMGSGELYKVMTFKADLFQADGEHSVECSSPFVLDQPGNSWVGFPIGCGLSCVGFVLLVIGFVRWLQRRSAASAR